MDIKIEELRIFRDYSLDLRRGTLSRGGREVELRPKSFSVLCHLVENAGRLVSKEELSEQLWKNVTVTDASLARCISDIRVALRDHDQTIIRTLARRGYLWVAQVSHQVAPPPTEPAVAPQRPAREYRQLTILSVDLAVASSGRDPEELHRALICIYKCCKALIDRHHGYVARQDGDGLAAYFGFPVASELDAENAVRAALELSGFGRRCAEERGVRLCPASGIATGRVMIGNGCGVATEELFAVGETLTLAGRLQELAQPGQIIIEASTRRLIGRLFDCRDLDLITPKGFDEPIEVSQVLRISDEQNRFAAIHPASHTPLVGRDEERDLLLRRWRQAETGEGLVVLLGGEPGIGKSRLAQAMSECVTNARHSIIRLFCSPHHQATPLHPFIRFLERTAGFQRDDTDAQRLGRLEAAAAAVRGYDRTYIPVLADLLSLQDWGRYPPPVGTSRQRRSQTLAALLTYVERLALSQPLLLIVEDVHWADPTSIELIDLIVDRVPALPMQALITFRPEFVPPWLERPNVTSITLRRLSKEQSAAVIAGVTPNRPLPQRIARQIVDRADGIPLFIEELTKAVAERIPSSERDEVAEELPLAAVPVSLRASLLARLDGLGPARQIAQTGAALGRHFTYHLIRAVAGIPSRTLDEALELLVKSGFVWCRGVLPHAEYMFKHALIQDATYETLLRETRRALHARIATVLQDQAVGVVEPEVLAHHCTQAGLIEKAAHLWGKAGELSLERSALQEAVVQLTRALRQIETLPATPALQRDQVRLQIALANALMHTKGYSAPETKRALDQARSSVERAAARGEPLEDPLSMFSVMHGFWVASHVGFDGVAVRDLAMKIMKLAKQQSRTFPLIVAHRVMGTSLVYLGKPRHARIQFNKALALYDPIEHQAFATHFGQDVGVAILANRPLALWLLGYPEAAQRDCDEAIRSAKQVGQSATTLYALVRTASFNLVAGNFTAAAEQSQGARVIAEEIDGSYWKTAGITIDGCLRALSGDAREATSMIRSGIDGFRSSGSMLRMPWYWSCLAIAHARLGQVDEAETCLDEALTTVRVSRETWQEPDLHRLAGDLALMHARPDPTKAEQHFLYALRLAQSQRAKLWELRAATSLARLWSKTGKTDRARELLAPIVGWFDQRFDAPDLLAAISVLSELS
jgi:DNA-binding winged helix-turn-helix (wHTH) protein/predicted ATPase